MPFVFSSYDVLGTFGVLDRLLLEPFCEVGPEEPDLADDPTAIAEAYPLELDIVDFTGG